MPYFYLLSIPSSDKAFFSLERCLEDRKQDVGTINIRPLHIQEMQQMSIISNHCGVYECIMYVYMDNK